MSFMGRLRTALDGTATGPRAVPPAGPVVVPDEPGLRAALSDVGDDPAVEALIDVVMGRAPADDLPAAAAGLDARGIASWLANMSPWDPHAARRCATVFAGPGATRGAQVAWLIGAIRAAVADAPQTYRDALRRRGGTGFPRLLDVADLLGVSARAVVQAAYPADGDGTDPASLALDLMDRAGLVALHPIEAAQVLRTTAAGPSRRLIEALIAQTHLVDVREALVEVLAGPDDHAAAEVERLLGRGARCALLPMAQALLRIDTPDAIRRAIGICRAAALRGEAGSVGLLEGIAADALAPDVGLALDAALRIARATPVPAGGEADAPCLPPAPVLAELDAAADGFGRVAPAALPVSAPRTMDWLDGPDGDLQAIAIRAERIDRAAPPAGFVDALLQAVADGGPLADLPPAALRRYLTARADVIEAALGRPGRAGLPPEAALRLLLRLPAVAPRSLFPAVRAGLDGSEATRSHVRALLRQVGIDDDILAHLRLALGTGTASVRAAAADLLAATERAEALPHIVAARAAERALSTRMAMDDAIHALDPDRAPMGVDDLLAEARAILRPSRRPDCDWLALDRVGPVSLRAGGRLDPVVLLGWAVLAIRAGRSAGVGSLSRRLGLLAEDDRARLARHVVDAWIARAGGGASGPTALSQKGLLALAAGTDAGVAAAAAALRGRTLKVAAAKALIDFTAAADPAGARSTLEELYRLDRRKGLRAHLRAVQDRTSPTV